jgi:hypothetical protein
LNERRDRFKSLAMVVGMPGNMQADAELTCGVVVISYFDFHHDSPRQRDSVLPPVHLDFARTQLAAVLQRHWQRVSGCPTGAVP